VSAKSIEPLIRAHFGEPRYIWLMRRNTIAEGISYYRAAKTGIWRSFETNAMNSNADDALGFDFAGIEQFIRIVEESNRRKFRRNNRKLLMHNT
jgi:LPS sulfotransferase NodH